MYLHIHFLKLLEVWFKLTVEDIIGYLNERERNAIVKNQIKFPRLIERETNTIYLTFFLKQNEVIPDGLVFAIDFKMMKKVPIKVIYTKKLQRIVERNNSLIYKLPASITTKAIPAIRSARRATSTLPPPSRKSAMITRKSS